MPLRQPLPRLRHLPARKGLPHLPPPPRRPRQPPKPPPPPSLWQKKKRPLRPPLPAFPRMTPPPCASVSSSSPAISNLHARNSSRPKRISTRHSRRKRGCRKNFPREVPETPTWRLSSRKIPPFGRNFPPPRKA
ncbi:hypothetical protein EBZ02_02575 [bacterium]|nr:hypothetical protein [bacterium]